MKQCFTKVERRSGILPARPLRIIVLEDADNRLLNGRETELAASPSLILGRDSRGERDAACVIALHCGGEKRRHDRAIMPVGVHWNASEIVAAGYFSAPYITRLFSSL